MQIQENKIVDHYLSSKGLTGLPISKETTIRVSDQVRKDFNINESSFIALKMAERAFFREDVGFLLTHKEGVCGEGTRVIVNLLNRLGFDATRVTLFNRELESSHTLVSVVIDTQEFFIDSINSNSYITELLKSYDISSNDFNLMHYSDKLAKRREFTKKEYQGNIPEGYIDFFNYFWLYSYEAMPYTKLLTTIGVDCRMFNFGRPPSWISNLAEKPNTILLFITLATSIFATYLLHKLGIIQKILQRDSVKFKM